MSPVIANWPARLAKAPRSSLAYRSRRVAAAPITVDGRGLLSVALPASATDASWQPTFAVWCSVHARWLRTPTSIGAACR